MRAVFSLIGLLVVVAIVGLLAKKQLSAVAPAPAAQAGAVSTTAPKNQVQQVRQVLDATLQAPRPMPDDTK